MIAMANNVVNTLNFVALFTVGVVGGHAAISMLNDKKKNMASENSPNPSDAESMRYEGTEAKVIIPYSLDSGVQGSLYRDNVWDGQDHFPFEGEMYSRPALTTLMYDAAYGSSPSRTINLPYRMHENEPVSLPTLTVAGSYAMGSPTTLEAYGAETFHSEKDVRVTGTALTGECPRDMRFDSKRGICIPTEQPQRDYGAEFKAHGGSHAHTSMTQYASEATPQMQLGDKMEGSQNSFIEQSTDNWVGDNWEQVGYHPDSAHFPLIRPRTNNPVVSDMINKVSSVEMPAAQHLSVGRDSVKMYDPYTFMNENPTLNAQYRPTDTQFGEDNETMTRREWQSSNKIFDYTDQTVQTQSKYGGFRQTLRRV